MIGLFKPKHTSQSVALEIQSGLKRENVFLNDEALNEAGYEVHTIETVPLFSSFNQIVFLALPAIFYSLFMVFEILAFERVWPSWSHHLGLLFIQFYVVFVHYIHHRAVSSLRRYITKKSSRRE